MTRCSATRFGQLLLRVFPLRFWIRSIGPITLLLGVMPYCVGQLPAQATGNEVKASAASFPPPHWVRKFGAPPGLSYVGSRVCAECHSSIARTQHRTAMSQASLLPSKSNFLSSGKPLTYREGRYLLRIEQADGQEAVSLAGSALSALVLRARRNSLCPLVPLFSGRSKVLTDIGP